MIKIESEQKVYLARFSTLLLVFMFGLGAGTLFKHQDSLYVQNFEVRGVDAVLAKEILAYSGISNQEHIFLVNLERIKKNIETHPKVKSAHVFRAFPNGLKSHIQLRQEKAVLALNRLYLVDVNGDVFERWNAVDSKILPVITGLQAKGLHFESKKHHVQFALTLMDKLERLKLHNPIEELHFDNLNSDWLIYFTDGLKVSFAEGKIEKRIHTFNKIIQYAKSKQRSIEMIHLNHEKFLEKVVFRFQQSSEMNEVKG